MNKLRNAILYTMLIVVVFRIGVHIPVPFVNVDAIKSIIESDTFSFLSILNGGGLTNFSILALGVSPYITSSIIVQLLQADLSKTVTSWSEQGRMGHVKTKRLTLVLSAIFGFLQAMGLTIGFSKYSNNFIPNPTMFTYVIIALTMTVGSLILTWVGEFIDDKGLASGISLVIFGGIISRIPSELSTIYQNGLTWKAVLAFVILITIIVFVEQSQLRLPLYYSKKSLDGDYLTWLPIKINVAGIIPVILAGSLFSIVPLMDSVLFSGTRPDWMTFVLECFTLASKKGVITYGLMIVIFTLFYSHVQLNPERVAEHLGKANGYIVGVRPGLDTEKYISRKLNKLSFISSIYLILVSVVPITTILGLQQSSVLSGTTMLILIGVSVEIYRNIKGKQTVGKYL